jgi:hypothetical protein
VTSAWTDSSEASLARLRLASQCGKPLGGVCARRAVGCVQLRERDLERDRRGALVEVDLERGDLLLEQAPPRVAGRQRLLGEDLLLRLGEQVRAVAAGRAQVVPAEVEVVMGEQLVGARVVDLGPLELEEQQLRLDRRRALLHPLVERAARRVGGVGREVQAAERAGARDDLLQPAELAHRLLEAGAVELGDVARVALREAVGALLRLGQHRVDGGDRVGRIAVEQRLEIPRDLQDLRIGDVGAHGGGG